MDSQRLHNGYALCSIHFEQHYFKNDMRTSLIQDAVPTLFHAEDNIAETSPSSSCSTATSEMKNKQSDADGTAQRQTFLELYDTYENSPVRFADVGLDQDKSLQEMCLTAALPGPCCIIRHKATQTDPPWKAKTSVIVDNTSKTLLCRLCASLVPCSQMVHIFGQLSASKQYFRKMNQLLPSSEQAAKNDFLPQWMCNNCCVILDYCDQAIIDFLAANMKLKRMLSNVTHSSGNKKRKTPRENTFSCSLTKPDDMDSMKEDLTSFDCQPIKEEIFGEEQCEEQYYDMISEQSDYDDNVNQQTDNNNIRRTTESQACVVTGSVRLEKIKPSTKIKTQNTAKEVNLTLRSDPSIKLAKTKSGCQVDDNEDCKILKKLSPSKKLKICQESQHLVIQNSHTTILISKEENTILCEKCNMAFDSVETALTHRFKEHSQEEIFKASSRVKKN